MALEPDSDWRHAARAAGGEAEAADLEDPVYGPWWYVSPRRLIGKMLVIAASIGLMGYGLTAWLKYEWANAPTIYLDGRVVQPGDRQKSGSWSPKPVYIEEKAPASRTSPER